MNFSYSKIPAPSAKNSLVLRPIIKVNLIGRKIWEGSAHIDSGSDLSLFNINIAKYIGLDLSSAKIANFGGIGKGSVRALIVDVRFEIPQLGKEAMFPIGFTVSKDIPNLLGQEGFFDNFVIKFDRGRDTIEIN